ncbi:dITPase [Pseudorhodobacter antarcticus]|jgi:XTP/dITP diphosphohydrolase|uniref:dITP/XTP pyrophosphatase n=1 Tax=Pseudorhodobacter antarcticus TaxID=1077947 RepID=A0A1H8C000_9RHOB|nr:RdgB/HAM1 family non-canonical purine NTP pyrophosphatase [Pseudorhodobacter antarcticus]SEM88455.1 dITPase [Pseudorhodobacter antarcticus]
MRQFTEKTLLVATHNAGKLTEISQLLAAFDLNVISAASLGLPEPDETEDNFVGNARIKAHTAARATGFVTLADDSGISVDALSGAPGVYTADWAETPAGRDFEIAMKRTWAELEAIEAPYPRCAQFRCTLVLAWPDGHDEVFEGVMPGAVVWPMRGTMGHGYDPIFKPDGYDLTFAQMAPELKNNISHRADAFRKLVAGCFT